MAFQFKIDEVSEIHRDPIGHYHHWTILGGNLIHGTMRRGDFIKLPFSDGTFLVTHILDFFLFSRPLGIEISAGQLDHPFGVVVWRPAPQQSQLLLDVAVDSTHDDFWVSLLEMLQRHPEQFFHNRGEKASQLDCLECTYEIPNSPETRRILELLQTQSDLYVARRATELLQFWGKKFSSQ